VIVDKLKGRWSPELIAGRLKRENVASISHQTIYNYVAKNRPLKPYLKFGTKRGSGRRAQRAFNKEKYRSIHERSKSVLNRNRFGHWERDGMYAGDRKQVLVCLERKSRYILMEPMGKVTSEKVNLLTEHMLKDEKVLSMTNDNGSEFRKHMKWNIPVYHCDPMRPDQRGSVENVIGTLRLYINRKTDLNKLERKGIKEIQLKLNLRPRKMFDYKTPYEIYFNKKVALVS
jgi:IS30 family transposase